jgi:hypothetical protein
VKPQQHWRADAQARTGNAKFLHSQGAEIVNAPDRGVRLPSFAVRGAGERDPHATLAQMRQDAPVKDFVIGMGEHNE